MLEPLRLAPLESFLPSGTFQLGPPVCANEKDGEVKIFISYHCQLFNFATEIRKWHLQEQLNL